MGKDEGERVAILVLVVNQNRALEVSQLRMR